MSSVDQQTCITCDSELEVFIDQIWDDRYGCPGLFSIRRCISCGQMVTTPRLREEDLPALYSRHYPRRTVDFEDMEREAALVAAPLAGFRRWLAGTDNQGHYLARPGQSVLDIGSGSCLSLLELRGMGVTAYGLEADPNVRAIADRYGLKVHIGSIHDGPFADESFDLIVLNQVIEHVPDPKALLRVVKGRLKSGGRVVLSFPNADSWHRILFGRRWINWHVPYHQHHFNRHSFRLLAQSEGYQVGRVRSITPNLWSLLQIRALGTKTFEGHASDSWGSGDGRQGSISLSGRIRAGLKRRLSKAVGVFLVGINRCVDALGKGDSLLVELRSNSSIR